MDEFDRILKNIADIGAIPVVSLPCPISISKLVDALVEGGVPIVEITFRGKYYEKALRDLSEFPSEFIYGVGTVKTRDQIDIALKYGASFAVSPGFNEDIVDYAKSLGLPFIPGVDSTLGIERAISHGITLLKMFPASVIGGISWLKSMAGPYPEISFIPTGGINFDNMADFLVQPNVIAVGGSFITPSRVLEKGDFEMIKANAKKARDLVQKKG